MHFSRRGEEGEGGILPWGKGIYVFYSEHSCTCSPTLIPSGA